MGKLCALSSATRTTAKHCRHQPPSAPSIAKQDGGVTNVFRAGSVFSNGRCHTRLRIWGSGVRISSGAPKRQHFQVQIGPRPRCHAERKILHGICMAILKFAAIRENPTVKQNRPFCFSRGSHARAALRWPNPLQPIRESEISQRRRAAAIPPKGEDRGHSLLGAKHRSNLRCRSRSRRERAGHCFSSGWRECTGVPWSGCSLRRLWPRSALLTPCPPRATSTCRAIRGSVAVVPYIGSPLGDAAPRPVFARRWRRQHLCR
jgi:hypothetical protein